MTEIDTAQIRKGFDGYFSAMRDLKEAYRRSDWQVLGYESWEAYCAGEFSGLGLDRIAVVTGLPPSRRKEADTRSVYFIRALQGGLIKIGVAANVTSRLAEIQRMCPIPLTIVATIAGLGQMGETALHHRFAAARRHGEWFEPVADLLAYIDQIGVRP